MTRVDAARARQGAAVAALIAMAVGISACGVADPPHPASTVTPSAGTVAAGVALTDGEMATTLAAAGIATVPDATADADTRQPVTPVTGPTVLTVTSWQASTMAAETRTGGGITGADLDRILPLGAGAPPLAFLIGAWAVTGSGRTAQAARRLLGTRDWYHAEQVVFPTSVLQLFVADVLGHVRGASGSSPSPGAMPPGGGGSTAITVDLERQVPAVAPPTGSCTGIASFVDGVLSEIFGALKLDPAEVGAWISGTLGGGVLGTIAGAIGGFLAAFWNKAVDFAEQTVRGVLNALTAPVLNALRTVIGALETITTVVSYLHRWQAPITPEPGANSFWTIGDPKHRGSFTVAIDRKGESRDWPALLTDCAAALGKPVPTLSSEGMPVTWGVAQQEAGLVTVDRPEPPQLTGALNADLTDRLDYTTGSETSKLAHSSLVDLSRITVTAHVRRSEVEQLADLLMGYLAANFPPILQPTIRAILGPLFGWAKAKLDIISAVDGSRTIVISHHVPEPPQETPRPSPSASTAQPASPPRDVDVCGLLSAADVSAPGGVTYGAATPVHLTAGWNQCSYANAGHSDPVDIYPLRVEVLTISGCYALLQSTTADATDTTPVAGVGSRAFGYRIGIVTQAGSSCVKVQGMTHAELDGDYSRDIAIARLLISRLG